jgi:hypothetical protein
MSPLKMRAQQQQQQPQKKPTSSSSGKSSTGSNIAASKDSKKKLVLGDEEAAITTAAAAAGAGEGAAAGTMAITTNLPALKSVPTTDTELHSPKSARSSGDDTPLNTSGSEDPDDGQFHDVDLKDGRDGKASAGAIAPGAAGAKKAMPKWVLYTLIVVLICLIAGGIVVVLRATNNLAYGTSGLIQAFDYTYSPTAAPSGFPTSKSVHSSFSLHSSSRVERLLLQKKAGDHAVTLISPLVFFCLPSQSFMYFQL